MVAEVIVNYKSKKVDKLYDYKIPDELDGKISAGSCVTVPFGRGNKPKEAYVFSLKEKSSAANLKEISNLSRQEILFDEKQIELMKWMRNKYLITYLDAVRAIVPSGATVNREEWIVLENAVVKGKTAKQITEILSDNGGAMEINRLMGCFEANISGSLATLRKNGNIKTVFKEHQSVTDKIVRVAELAIEQEDVAEVLALLEKSNALVQAKMLDILSDCERLSLADLVHFSEG